MGSAPKGHESATEKSTNLPPQTPENVFRVIDRPGLGFSFQVPETWTVHGADPAGGLLLATSDATGPEPAWARVFRSPPGEGVAVTAQRVIAGLGTLDAGQERPLLERIAATVRV